MRAALVDPDQRAHESAWDDLPYPAVPPHTRRGVTHQVVEVKGTFFAGWHRVGQTVIGSTRCGKRDLMMDRDASGFPLCKRCWPECGEVFYGDLAPGDLHADYSVPRRCTRQRGHDGEHSRWQGRT